MRRCDEARHPCRRSYRYNRRCQVQDVRLRLGHCQLQLPHHSGQGQALYVLGFFPVTLRPVFLMLLAVDDAAAIKNVDIASELCLPPVKRMCNPYVALQNTGD